MRPPPRWPAGAVAALTTGFAALGCLLVALAAGRQHAPASVAVGALLVLGFCSAAGIPLWVAGDGTQGRAGLGYLVLGLTYALRLVLALAVLRVSAHTSALDDRVLGLTVIACALAWTASRVATGLSRRRQLGG